MAAETKASTSTTIDDPAQAWHLAQVDAFQQALCLLNANLRAPERMPAEEIGAAVTRLRLIFGRAAREHWEQYVDLTEDPTAQPSLMDGETAKVDFDEARARPVVVRGAEQEIWPRVELEGADANDRFEVTAPFRAVVLERLPPGCKLVPIEQAEHTALASMAEVMRMLHADLTAAARGVSPKVGWMRTQRLLRLYRGAVRLTLRAMRDRELRPTTDALLRAVELAQAPQVVAGVAQTMRAQQLIAIHLGASLLRQLMARLIGEGGTFEERASKLIEIIRYAREETQLTLAKANRALARIHHRAQRGEHLEVILRPIPQGPPLLVIVPPGEAADVIQFPISS